MQFARSLSNAVRSLAPLNRGSARIFHFYARVCVQEASAVGLQKSRHVFRRISPCWAFLVGRADSAAWPHRNRGTCGASRDPAKSLSPPQRSYFPKALNGAAGYQHLERGANEMVSNWCSPNIFSTERVLLLSAESVCRT